MNCTYGCNIFGCHGGIFCQLAGLQNQQSIARNIASPSHPISTSIGVVDDNNGVQKPDKRLLLLLEDV